MTWELDYDPPLYRPPSEGENLILQATLGCSFNHCAFCAMYRSKHFRVRPLETLVAEIDRYAADWPDAHRVFLADGDALVLPTAHLLALLDHLALRLPRLARVSCYATPANLRKKSLAELTLLREKKLTLLYYGIETGSPALLKRIGKGATPRGMIEGLRKAESAGMKVSATVILGLGGVEGARDHVEGTVALLRQAPVHYLSTLRLELAPEVREEFRRRFDPPFRPQGADGILTEMEGLIHGLDAPARAMVFRSNHVSNLLPLAGALPRDRERLLAEIRLVREGSARHVRR